VSILKKTRELQPENAKNLSEKHIQAKQAQCPFCKSRETELYALFGSQLSTSQYYCKGCRTVFEYIKWE